MIPEAGPEVDHHHPSPVHLNVQITLIPTATTTWRPTIAKQTATTASKNMPRDSTPSGSPEHALASAIRPVISTVTAWSGSWKGD